ncbi:SUKH-3 domain-containing protein [Streptosporangiaceae bacterium NEAU-GS5]|nr:SUKH-3 domain-containing protein [Streptosporangiaceae bacterium NEAU-GS5]
MDGRTLLAQAGWFADRDVGERASGIASLREAGYVVGDAVEKLLREYSGLTMQEAHGPSSVWIDGAYAARMSDPGGRKPTHRGQATLLCPSAVTPI